MATYDYDDLRVTFRRADDGSYRVSAAANRDEPVVSTFTLPMSTTSLEQAIARLGMGRSREAPTVDGERAETVDAELFGTQLGAALFDGPLGPLYDNARNAAAEQGRGLRLTLSMAETPELLGVPWELLYRAPTFLASQRRTPIVRYLEVGTVPPPLRITGAVRVLGVVASPSGAEALNTGEERARVETALKSMIDDGRVTLTWCDPATPKKLREMLRDGDFHILHYIGHSDFDAAGEGVILLENEDGTAARINESRLKLLLADQTSSLRLAVLNSCDGARTTLTDPFSGIATCLVRLGVPAVIAMQFRITDEAAIAFGGELFTSLIGRQFPVDAAVAEARKAVYLHVNEIEWATPVLFLRTTDSDLFDFASQPAAIPLITPPGPLQPDQPDQTDQPDQPKRRRWLPTGRRRRTVLVAAAVLVGALAGGVGIVVWPDDGTVAACGGEPVPERPPYDGPGGDVEGSYLIAQRWADLGASAVPDDTERNDEIWEQMRELYPGTFARPWLDLGARRQEAVTLLYLDSERPEAAASAPLWDTAQSMVNLYVGALYYENATTTDACRTAFNCVRYVVDPRLGQIVDRQASGRTLTEGDELHWPAWLGPNDPASITTGQTVAELLEGSCADATYE
jgi:hypothetical protein